MPEKAWIGPLCDAIEKLKYDNIVSIVNKIQKRIKRSTPMNKLYLLLMLGISLLLLGCVQPPATQYVCPDGTTVTNQALCTSTGAAATGAAATGAATTGELTIEQELEVCVGMPAMQQGSLEDMCVVGIAAKHGDTSLCRRIGSDQRHGCYAIIATVKSDPGICLEAGLKEDQCYEQYASIKRDSSACARIKAVHYKDNCYNNLANQLGDASLCGEMQNLNQKDNCYRNMAHQFNDPSHCNSITDSVQKQNCLNEMQGGREGK